jgi:hypothetical protein
MRHSLARWQNDSCVEMTRPVDRAMAAERPEKKTVRALWVEEVRHAKAIAVDDTVPRYLTLPGALGLDIAVLVEAGLVEVTPTGALANPRRMELIAVERSAEAVIELQRRWPGLKILTEPLQSLLRSTSMVSFPEGEHRRFFRAQVINFDLDEPLKAIVERDQLMFPVLALVRKLATLHAEPPRVDWTLCLTLHGEVAWQAESDELACRFLCSNFERDQRFSDQAQDLLGKGLYEAIRHNPRTVSVRNRPFEEQQRFIKVLVPKRIAFDAHTLGWNVDTRENLHYGGTSRRAPMVTWVMRHTSDPRASTEPDMVYREAIARSLERCGRIDSRGRLSRP